MITGDPICPICGKYTAWCGGCPYSPFIPKQFTSILDGPNLSKFNTIWSNPPSNFLENRIKFLEEENEYLKERVEILQSFHAETCEVISGGIKCSCHLMGVK